MSAFIVTAEHIAELVLNAKHCERSAGFSSDWSRILNTETKQPIALNADSFMSEAIAAGFLLAWANGESVDHRYKNSEDRADWIIAINHLIGLGESTFSEDWGMADKLPQLIRMCDCLEYQSCEVDDYYQSDQYFLLAKIKGIFVSSLVDKLIDQSEKEGRNPTTWSYAVDRPSKRLQEVTS
jgi:hypothetical protein